jgi:hypothetical protein
VDPEATVQGGEALHLIFIAQSSSEYPPDLGHSEEDGH